MASKQLESEIWRYAKSLHDKKDWPAMVVGAEYGQLRSKKKSGCLCSLHRTLYKKLATIGELYTKINGCALGCCAEINAANNILRRLRHPISLASIDFSTPYRPRTMQPKKMCTICKKTFTK